MQILRDLFPTDAGTPYFTLALETRDLHAHSLLSALGEDDRTAISDALAEAVETIAQVLRKAIREGAPAPGTSSFGCGT
jgi:hypothetical protein